MSETMLDQWESVVHALPQNCGDCHRSIPYGEPHWGRTRYSAVYQRFVIDRRCDGCQEKAHAAEEPDMDEIGERR